MLRVPVVHAVLAALLLVLPVEETLAAEQLPIHTTLTERGCGLLRSFGFSHRFWSATAFIKIAQFPAEGWDVGKSLCEG